MTDLDTTASPTPAEGPPAYDAAAVGRVAKRIEIESVELLGVIFQRADDTPLPVYPSEATPQELGIGVEWEVDATTSILGCAISFAAKFESEGPYELIARFGLRYAISGDQPINEPDLNQFAHWNAVFNAWPYWRELASSTIARTGFKKLIVPVLPVPRDSGSKPMTKADD